MHNFYPEESMAAQKVGIFVPQIKKKPQALGASCRRTQKFCKRPRCFMTYNGDCNSWYLTSDGKEMVNIRNLLPQPALPALVNHSVALFYPLLLYCTMVKSWSRSLSHCWNTIWYICCAEFRAVTSRGVSLCSVSPPGWALTFIKVSKPTIQYTF